MDSRQGTVGAEEPITVLLVGTDPTAGVNVGSVLEDEYGMDVVTATTVADVFAVLEEASLDCIVSDGRFPDNAGERLLTAVRSMYPTLPYFVFTDVTAANTVNRILEAGATDYVSTNSGDRYYRLLASRIVRTVERRGDDEHPPSQPPTPAGSCLLDEECSFVAVSEGFANPLGYGVEELVGNPWTDLWPDEDPKRIKRKATSDGPYRRTSRNVTAVRKDGTRVLTRRVIDRIDGEYLCLSSVAGGREFNGIGPFRSIDPRQIVSKFVPSSNKNHSFEARLERIVSYAATELDCEYVGIFERRADEETITLRAGVGWEQSAIARQLDGSADPHVERTIAADEPVVFETGRPESPFDRSRILTAHDIAGGISAKIGIDNRPWGVIGVYTAEPREFSVGETEFLQTVGTLLTIAVEMEATRQNLVTLERGLQTAGDCDTLETICELVVDVCARIRGLSVAAVYLYDEADDVLRLAGKTSRFDTASDELPFDDGGTDPCWQTFFEREPVSVATLLPQPARPVDDPALGRGIVLPLSGHGILITGACKGDRPTAPELAIAHVLAMVTRLLLDGVGRNDRLESIERERATDTATIDRLVDGIELMQDVGKLIEDSRTRDALESALCERFVTDDSCTFVWIGENNEAGETIVPRERAGLENDYLERLRTGGDDWAIETEPLVAAIDTGKPQTVDRLIVDSSSAQWRTEALKRGFRSICAFPFVFRGVCYGGIAMYAERPGVFSDLDHELFQYLGLWIGHAINTIETKRTLVGTDVVELEFQIEDEQFQFLEWTTETDCTITFESMTTRPDGSLRGFFTVTGATVDEIQALTERATVITDMRFVTERGDRHLFECTLTDESVIARLLDYGAVPKRITASEGRGSIVVHLPTDADVRRFVTTFTRTYPRSTVVRQQDRERTAISQHEFGAELERRLTDRQLEVLQTAYASGYFTVPRETTGTDVAAMLEIAQPTFNHHLRAAQRKLLSMIFDEGLTGLD
ncbi:bacterio-opsin activator domain-containing protein [Natronorubrum thiooxidans]|uniref:PAS domain S-box-containing protein n=1 Tax=Natronorubrum thiooxidans TaxID=308853 RepID=A0A1N7GME1_9EURY|nr:bacterio-opsin activator domain-containing protein [Natronorubrum thiooxidans]SIS13720.1 PAS domain S-box-containing protein [Natronorubrum thiooxidans]